MTEKGDPYKNAIAERVNGILKTEFSLASEFRTYQQAQKAIEHSIQVYNHLRPHASIDYLTPGKAHVQAGFLKKRWKVYPYQKEAKENKKAALIFAV
jgi:putative transposase